MDQQQIKISFPLGTKLLLSVVLLLVAFIVFLNISSIFLFREDKQRYTYQSQSNEALLVGKVFVNKVSHALDTLRIFFASVDPKSPVKPQDLSNLKSIINNQSEISSGSIYILDPAGNVKLYAAAHKGAQNSGASNELSENSANTSWLSLLLPELKKNSYAFLNVSKPGEPPVLAVALADQESLKNSNLLHIAIGLMPLSDFVMESKRGRLTIATSSGWILYDSEPDFLYSKENISQFPLFHAATESRLVNGAKEYEFDGKQWLGSYVSPGLSLVVLSSTEWSQAMKAAYRLIEKFILLGSMAVGAAMIFAILFAKTLTAPLERLYNATREIESGNFKIHLQEKGRDEISALSSSFNSMSQRIDELIQESMAKIGLEKELEIASAVQQTLMPPESFQFENLKLQSFYRPATQCGGDWWGFFGVGKKVSLMIADATGHGVASALITAAARSSFSFMNKLAQEDPEFTFSPSAMLTYTNRVIYDASLGSINMTFFVGVLDLEKMELTYSSAGHNPPWLFKKNENGGFELKSLVAPGSRLGETRDVAEYEERVIGIAPSDILFLYTDGLIEGKNQAGVQYSKKRMRQKLEESLSGGPEAIIAALAEDFLRHNEGKALDDDITMAAAIILG